MTQQQRLCITSTQLFQRKILIKILYSKLLKFLFITSLRFTPIIGAVIADVYLGPYRTLKYSILITILADIILTVTSIQVLRGSHLAGLVITLLIKCVASGGISPSLGTFGKENFFLPQNSNKMRILLLKFFKKSSEDQQYF
jgi:hypothetical protein